MRTWMLTSSFNILTCAYLWTKAMKKLSRYLFEEEDSSQCLKIYRSSQLRKSTSRDSRPFVKEKRSDSFDKYDDKHPWHLMILSSSLAISVFKKKKTNNERAMEATSSHTQFPVFERLRRHIGERKPTMSLVMTKQTFWTWRICISILLSTESLCNVLLFPWANLNFHFFKLVKWLSNHLSCTCFQSLKQKAI